MPPFLPDTPTCRAELAEYCQSVSRVDQGIGRLVQILKDTGHWDDTLFVFLSDNGVPFPGAKTTVYDAGLNLPCLVRNPAAESRGVRSKALVSWVDIAPTVLEFAGVRARPNCTGDRYCRFSARPTRRAGMRFTPRTRTTRSRCTTQCACAARASSSSSGTSRTGCRSRSPPTSITRQPGKRRSARGASSLYGKRTVAAYVDRPAFELYDLEKDPDEVVNLADQPAHAATLADLKSKLKQFQQRTQDPWLHKWTYE